MSDLKDMALCDEHYKEVLFELGVRELPVLTIKPLFAGCRVCDFPATGYYEGLPPLKPTVQKVYSKQVQAIR